MSALVERNNHSSFEGSVWWINPLAYNNDFWHNRDERNGQARLYFYDKRVATVSCIITDWGTPVMQLQVNRECQCKDLLTSLTDLTDGGWMRIG